jgi:5-methylcytosine-specific restriction endonuclease McrA
MNDALKRTLEEYRAKVAASGMRAWPEWIGKTGDTAIPDKVRARVVLLWGAVCYITGKRLAPGEIEMEHVVALADGGENREGNLRPVWNAAHKIKTAKEKTRRSKADRIRIKHIGKTQSARPIQSRGFDKKPKPEKLPLPKQQGIYEVMK